MQFYSGSYDSLIGGFIDYGLADLTGMVSEQVVLRKTHLGYHETTGKLLSNDPQRHTKSIDNPLKPSFWNQMYDLSKHGSLMGCSIQPDPKAKNAAKVEAKLVLDYTSVMPILLQEFYEISFEDEKIKEFYTETCNKSTMTLRKSLMTLEDDSLAVSHIANSYQTGSKSKESSVPFNCLSN